MRPPSRWLQARGHCHARPAVSRHMLASLRRPLCSWRPLAQLARSTQQSQTNHSSCAAVVQPMSSQPQQDESWDHLLDILSGLITFKTRADGKGWRDAFENMPVYLEVGLGGASRSAASGSSEVPDKAGLYVDKPVQLRYIHSRGQQQQQQQQCYGSQHQEVPEQPHQVFHREPLQMQPCNHHLPEPSRMCWGFLVQRAGLQEDIQKLRVIHVAGTKGKVGQHRIIHNTALAGGGCRSGTRQVAGQAMWETESCTSLSRLCCTDLIQASHPADCCHCADSQRATTLLPPYPHPPPLRPTTPCSTPIHTSQGSTCAMVDSVLRSCGYRVGLFTSPHLCDVRERVRVNG